MLINQIIETVRRELGPAETDRVEVQLSPLANRMDTEDSHSSALLFLSVGERSSTLSFSSMLIAITL